ncbi:hypothetical protein L873DRAFT_1040179 [Choiromyces venosus 120613-1]|uniref:Nephrocystin 3-like N-terminal domain-containing protein n=1 Tax=Choiromyces venosus 120613-1 TaxID=1336337 RepID=A0A3N4JQG5_9PEZI|nr:hypothetical protein L873DRAFT_1040179 [Choiromyces venosus 120613-1]
MTLNSLVFPWRGTDWTVIVTQQASSPRALFFFSSAHTHTRRKLINSLSFPTSRGTISTFSQYSGQKIMAETTYTRSVTMGDNNTNCNNITTNFNKTINISDEDAQIMRWLSPLEPRNRHQGVRIDRFDGVGDWLLETPEFREWRTRRSDGETDEAVLFCFGNPGVGKTYIRYAEREPLKESNITNNSKI